MHVGLGAAAQPTSGTHLTLPHERSPDTRVSVAGGEGEAVGTPSASPSPSPSSSGLIIRFKPVRDQKASELAPLPLNLTLNLLKVLDDARPAVAYPTLTLGAISAPTLGFGGGGAALLCDRLPSDLAMAKRDKPPHPSVPERTVGKLSGACCSNAKRARSRGLVRPLVPGCRRVHQSGLFYNFIQ